MTAFWTLIWSLIVIGYWIMAMSNCKECGKAVSTKAKTCPNCGVPKPALKKKSEEKQLKQMKKEQWTGYLELKRREKEMSDYEKSKQAVDEYYSKSSSKSPKKTSSSTQTTSGEKDTPSKFLDGELDLATSFWGFLFVGTIIIGFVCGFLSAAYGKGWYIPLIGYTIFAIVGTWNSAEKYKIEQNKKKQTLVWGFLVQAVCILNGISIIGMIAEFF